MPPSKKRKLETNKDGKIQQSLSTMFERQRESELDTDDTETESKHFSINLIVVSDENECIINCKLRINFGLHFISGTSSHQVESDVEIPSTSTSRALGGNDPNTASSSHGKFKNKFINCYCVVIMDIMHVIFFQVM